MIRFWKSNLLQPVSFRQFQDTALSLQEAISQVRNDIKTSLFITTDYADYHPSGSLGMFIELLGDWREKHDIKELNEDVWKKSYNREFFIKANNPTSYMIYVSNGERQKRRLQFYSQCLDSQSESTFSQFRTRESLFTILDDWYTRPSNFSIWFSQALFNK